MYIMKHKSNLVHAVDTSVMATITVLLQILIILLPLQAVESAANNSLPGCPDNCGGIPIPYPFGIGPNCSYSFRFDVSCDKSSDGKLTPYLQGLEILTISIPLSQARINYPITYQLRNFSSQRGVYHSPKLQFNDTPLWLNIDKNKLVGIGCDVLAQLTFDDYSSVGCFSACNGFDISVLIKHGASCSGIGCCQIILPTVTKDISLTIVNMNETVAYQDFVTLNSYAMVVEEASSMFNTTYLTTYKPIEKAVPIVFDWTIIDRNSEYATQHSYSYVCVSNNSQFLYSSNDMGFICNCSDGYEGNPYLQGGCQDIDECASQNPCPQRQICHNLQGGYMCKRPRCSFGRRNYKDNICELNLSLVLGLTSALGLSTGIIILLLYIAIAKRIKLFERRNHEKLKQKFFIQNRGLLLQQLITSHEDTTQKMKIFRLDELEKATNNFDNALILGKGGHGEVYKGILLDQRVVAIKKSKIVNQGEIDQFINEVVILSQVNHRNVVKLFGCCLETEVPLLVYEFISNGTLHNHLHGVEHCFLTWKQRLRIALEAAGAISYLHSSASISVFHRDIKSSNILLDDYFTVKVSDFGASRSVQIDQTSTTTTIQGTYGYLDPEYYYTGRLTQKSDVYSFGVILAELLTREKPLSSSELFEGGSLIAYFSSAMNENRLFEILDPEVVYEENRNELEAVAKLAEMCLRMRGEDRPTMKEVEVRLEVLWRSNQQHNHPWTSDQSTEERALVLLDYHNVGGVDVTQKYSFEQEQQQSSSYFPR